jgi:predicted ester cyclase
MPDRTAEETARGVFAALAAHDLDGVRAYLAAEDHQEFAPVGELASPEAVVAFFGDMLAAFPDLDVTVEHVVADEHCAAVRWRLEGTFTGRRFLGLEPSGRRIRLRGADAMIMVRDGEIYANTIFYDGADFARAVGLLPARGSILERLLYTAFNAKVRVRRALGL